MMYISLLLVGFQHVLLDVCCGNACVGLSPKEIKFATDVSGDQLSLSPCSKMERARSIVMLVPIFQTSQRSFLP
jgi:hypothetical protein